ncbi:MAG: hypothetical protein C0507_16425 [Cyanobacteria bacterium PR.3.49]|nr:hypothetical protein [Cyanobacteria bacterium PR.3.49]
MSLEYGAIVESPGDGANVAGALQESAYANLGNIGIPKTPAADLANRESQSVFDDFPSIEQLLDGGTDLVHKLVQAGRIAPQEEKIEDVLSPELVAELKDYGLKSDATSIRNGFILAIASDYSLEELKNLTPGMFRAVAAFTAMGAISPVQGQAVLKLQAERRSEYARSHPDAPPESINRMFRIGDILREKYGPVIDVADKVIRPLQPPMK